MNLEDHVGDIIRKARAMSKVSTAAAARAAGLTEAELALLEETGQTLRKPNLAAPVTSSSLDEITAEYLEEQILLEHPELAKLQETGQTPRKSNLAALAELVGLRPAKLEAIANGWLPAEKDLSAWRELRCITTAAGGMAVNCYLVWDEVSREAALFDTGWEAGPISELLGENQLLLRHIFITHGHEDHVAALGELREKFPKARLHSGSKSAPVDQRNRPNDFIHLGSLRITHRETPGHAEDGTTYIVGTWPEDAPHVAIVGDALFAGSIGRGNQSWDLARQKVREQILTLPPETLICPGHGPLTTVAEEKEHNPFF